VGLSGASHEASGQKIKPEMPKLFLHRPLCPGDFRRGPDCRINERDAAGGINGAEFCPDFSLGFRCDWVIL
jgi:hypothetical protein